MGPFDIFGGIFGTPLFGAPAGDLGGGLAGALDMGMGGDTLDPPISGGFSGDVQGGDIGGAPSWGKPPVPGVSGAEPNQLSVGAPGGDTLAPGGIGGKLAAFAAGGGPNAAFASFAPGNIPQPPGLVGASPPTLAQTPRPEPNAAPQSPRQFDLRDAEQSPRQYDLRNPPTPPPRPEGAGSVPLAPSLAAAGTPLPGQPWGPDGAPRPLGIPTGTGLPSTAANPPTFGSPQPFKSDTPAGTPSATPGAATSPGAAALKKLFGSGMPKMGGGQGGGGKGASAGGDSVGRASNDPAAASRAGAPELFKSILQGHLIAPAGPVPQLPAGLLELFKRG